MNSAWAAESAILMAFLFFGAFLVIYEPLPGVLGSMGVTIMVLIALLFLISPTGIYTDEGDC